MTFRIPVFTQNKKFQSLQKYNESKIKPVRGWYKIMEKPNRFSKSLAKITKRFSRDNNNKTGACNSLCIPNCVCGDEGGLNGRNRRESIFRSLKKKFRGSKCKTKRADDVGELPVYVQEAPEVAPRVPVLEDRVPTPPPRDVNNKGIDDESNHSDEVNHYEPIRNEEIGNKSLGKEHFDLANYGWFWGPITKREAETRLHGEPDGSFIVRDSSSERHIFTLSFQSYGQTLHAHIDYSCGFYSLGDLTKRGVSELIDAAIEISREQILSYSKSRNPADPSYPVRLWKPVSRLMEVRSLKYLCRFIIRQYINVNNIQKLPLPTTLKNYLHQGQY